MSEDWNTKYGTRRVRRDPPTLDEAILPRSDYRRPGAAAEIAASLMGCDRIRARRSEEIARTHGAFHDPA